MRVQSARNELANIIAMKKLEQEAKQNEAQRKMWDVQGKGFASQAALDATKQNEVNQKLQAAGVLAGLMRQNSTVKPGEYNPWTPLIAEESTRLAALGQDKLPVNLAQIMYGQSPEGQALMATGASPTQTLGPGYSTVNPVTGALGVTAPNRPANDTSLLQIGNPLGAVLRGIEGMRGIDGAINPEDSERALQYQQTADMLNQLLLEDARRRQSGAPRTPTAVPPPATAAPSVAPAAPSGKVLVIDPQGRKGYVPQSQLQDALREGYRKAN